MGPRRLRGSCPARGPPGKRPPAHVSPPAIGHDAGRRATRRTGSQPLPIPRPDRPKPPLHGGRGGHTRAEQTRLCAGERRDAPPTLLSALGRGHCRQNKGAGAGRPQTDGEQRLPRHAKPQALHLFRTARSFRLPAPASRARAAQCTLMKTPRTRRRRPPAAPLATRCRLHDHGGAWTAIARDTPVGAGATVTMGAAGSSRARHK